MSSIYGKNITMTIFGESHNNQIGVTICNLQAGLKLDLEFIKSELSRRRPKTVFNTSRIELDSYQIISGYFNEVTTGAPLTFLINNDNVRSEDYSDISSLMRPGHADYSAFAKYKGYNDYRGGGHFSGRLTAPVVIAGAIAKQILKQIEIDFSSIIDVEYSRLEQVSNDGDSIGGQVKTIVSGVKAGVGEPMFDSLESRLSSGLFSIPGVKAVSFGLGEEFKNRLGSEVVDELEIVDEEVSTKTNYNGGINGGISNGMELVFNTTFKPATSISMEVNTIDVSNMENAKLKVKGRHDSFYVDRAVVVVEAIAAFTVLDLIIESEGKSWINLKK